MYETKPYFYGTGRRKDSVARVRVYTGTGKITINDRDIDNYFGLETLKLIVRSPLVLLGLEGKYDVVVRVSGGGVSGQAGAIRHGLSRALLQQSDENRVALKKAGFLTRDPRMKERGSGNRPSSGWRGYPRWPAAERGPHRDGWRRPGRSRRRR